MSTKVTIHVYRSPPNNVHRWISVVQTTINKAATSFKAAKDVIIRRLRDSCCSVVASALITLLILAVIGFAIRKLTTTERHNVCGDLGDDYKNINVVP